MAKILLIETATEVCSAAIAVDGRVIALAEDLQQPNHAARLTILIEQCVRQSGITLAGLDAVAVSRGPGSYTSLRVGVSVAKGICYALDKPLIALDTLQALAAASMDYGSPSDTRHLHGETPAPTPLSPRQTAGEDMLFIPMLDARRQEVWTAVYDAELREVLPAQPLILEHVLFDVFLQRAGNARPSAVFIVSGNGAKKTGIDWIGENVVISTAKNCSARYLAGLAEKKFQISDFQDVSYFEPVYMKLPNITTPNKGLF